METINKEYIDWIKNNLPITLKDKINLNGLYVEGLQIYCDQDKTSDKQLLFIANNEEELKLYLFEKVVEDIAIFKELKVRKQEEKKWRYVWDDKKTTVGNIVYKENENYIYNTEYDSRKYWFEYLLKLMKAVCNEEYFIHTVNKYTNLLNLHFDTPHWIYNYTNNTFEEI